MGQRCVLAQSAEDVFHIHDGIIHDHADGDGEAAEGHAVHADVEPLEDQHRDAEGERHRHEGDERGAEVQQEQEQNDRDHDGPVTNGFGEIADGVINEVLLLEQQRGLDALREGGLEFVQRGLDLLGELSCVKAGCFGDGHDDAVSGGFFRGD
jgi:hypothetical protein